MTTFTARFCTVALPIALAMADFLTLRAAPGAELSTPDVVDAVSEIDRFDFAQLVTRTAGDIRPEKAIEYVDFGAYWQAASRSFEGKTFEAIVADTVNARYRAVGDDRRLIPTATLGRPGDAVDLVMVNPAGEIFGRAQAKLGVQAVLDALSDARYAGMDIVTVQETLDSLRAELARSIATGKHLSPKMEALREAIGSGRVWNSLPCGAPLPQRSYVEAVTRSHYLSRWNVAATGVGRSGRAVAVTSPIGGPASAVDDAARAVAASGDHAVRQVRAIDDVARAAVCSADDVAMSLGKSVVRWAGPVATVVEVGVGAYECHGTEQRFASGEITQEDREVAHARVVGGIGGGAAGGLGGAALGAAIGTMACPVGGTVVGAVIGAIGGAIGGGTAGRYSAAHVIEALHRAGVTVGGVATRAGDRIRSGCRSAIGWWFPTPGKQKG